LIHFGSQAGSLWPHVAANQIEKVPLGLSALSAHDLSLFIHSLSSITTNSACLPEATSRASKRHLP
jgi:hypothetical protein